MISALLVKAAAVALVAVAWWRTVRAVKKAAAGLSNPTATKEQASTLSQTFCNNASEKREGGK